MLAHSSTPLITLHVVLVGPLSAAAAYGLRRWLEDRHERSIQSGD